MEFAVGVWKDFDGASLFLEAMRFLMLREEIGLAFEMSNLLLPPLKVKTIARLRCD